MLSTQWAPLFDVNRELNRLRAEMDRRFGRAANGQSGAAVYPALNLWETDDHFFVEAELPGFELSDLEIYVTGGNQLSIKGARKPPQLEGGTWHRQERGYGVFGRTVELPGSVETDQVSAEFKHGVLRITLPKHAEVKPRRIEVKAR